MRSIRSQARRIASGSRMPDKARRTASSSSAITSGGMLRFFCAVVIKYCCKNPGLVNTDARCHVGTPKHALEYQHGTPPVRGRGQPTGADLEENAGPGPPNYKDNLSWSNP